MKVIEKRCSAKNAYELVVPYNIVIDRYFSEEEKAENLKNSTAIMAAGKDAWNDHCEKIRKMIVGKIDALLAELEQRFEIGQLHDSGDKYPNYDLWFWCNSGDRSYITLNFLRHYKGVETEKIIADAERVEALYKKALEILEAYDDPNLCATIRFSTVELVQEIEKAAVSRADELSGKWVLLDNMIGKIWVDSKNRFCFKKKYSKVNCYIVNPAAVIRCEVIN